MTSPIAPGPRQVRWAPLPTISLLVGAVFAAFTVTSLVVPTLVAELARDPMFVRVLGATSAMAGGILARAAVRAAAGPRMIAGVAVASLFIALGVVLIVSPTSATWFHETERSAFVPWVFGVLAAVALALSQWRVR